MKLFGFNWRIGRSWGIAHPDHICYNDPGSVHIENGHFRLGIDYKPTTLVVDGEEINYDFSVGYVSSIDTIKYGHLKVTYRLPLGKNLWPAIWLTDAKTWPPEIDIMEAWSDNYEWPCKPKATDKIYRINPFANNIFPGLVLGNCIDNKHGKSYRTFRGSLACYIDVTKDNTCEIEWQKDRIRIYYNGHKVADEKDPKALQYFNDSEGMEIHLNNYVQNDFTRYDYNQMRWYDEYSPDFIIQDLVYEK